MGRGGGCRDAAVDAGVVQGRCSAAVTVVDIRSADFSLLFSEVFILVVVETSLFLYRKVGQVYVTVGFQLCRFS